MSASKAITSPADKAGTLDMSLGDLEQKLAAGLQFTNTVGFMNQESIKEDRALLYSLVELLLSQGTIHLYQIERRKKELAQSLEENTKHELKPHLVETPDKYQVEDQVVIDCENRYPLCKAACCKLWFALSVQDLDEGIVRWNYSQPYSISQTSDGRCIHQDRSSLKCGIYENRPHVCRTYDCSKDKRIWLDFENRVINPSLCSDDWPRNQQKGEIAAS